MVTIRMDITMTFNEETRNVESVQDMDVYIEDPTTKGWYLVDVTNEEMLSQIQSIRKRLANESEG